MAGDSLGATAPASSPSPSPVAACAPLALLPGRTSRRRLNHGCVNVGAQLACVYSARGVACYPVTVELGSGPLELTHRLTAHQARALAKALNSAASAAEQRGAA